VGNFSCWANDTWTPLKLVGGIRKGRPNADDLAAARAFAEGLRTQVGRSTPILSLFSINQDLPGLPMALRFSGRLTVLPTS
jgi:hypothetical protein